MQIQGREPTIAVRMHPPLFEGGGYSSSLSKTTPVLNATPVVKPTSGLQSTDLNPMSSQNWQAFAGVQIKFGETVQSQTPKSQAKSKELTELLLKYRLTSVKDLTKNTLKEKIDELIQDPAIDFNYGEKYRTSLVLELIKTAQSSWIRLAAQKGANFNQKQELSHEKSPLLAMLKANEPEDLLLEALSTLKALGVDFNQNEAGELSPLAYVCSRLGYLKVMEKLIDYGADINGSPRGGRPLLNAIVSNQDQKVALLLEKGADINVLTQRGESIIHFMVRRSLDELRKIVALGASVDIPDNNGVTPLMIAAETATYEVFRFLEKNGATINGKDRSGHGLLGRVAANPDSRVFQHWLHEADLSQVTAKEVKFALTRCLETNDSDRFKVLLKRFPLTPDTINGKAVEGGFGPPLSLLMMACINPGLEWAIELLLQAEANPNGSASPSGLSRMGEIISPIELIVGNDPGEKFGRQTEEQIEQFLDAGLDPNLIVSTGIPLFFVVAAKGTVPLIEKMLAKGANPNIKDHHGNNLCLFAAKMGCPDVLQTWARRGVDPLAKNTLGLTARDITEAALEELESVPLDLYNIGDAGYLNAMRGNYQDTLLLLDHFNVPGTPGGKQKEIYRLNTDRNGGRSGIVILNGMELLLDDFAY